jgi:hypothetical protein
MKFINKSVRFSGGHKQHKTWQKQMSLVDKLFRLYVALVRRRNGYSTSIANTCREASFVELSHKDFLAVILKGGASLSWNNISICFKENKQQFPGVSRKDYVRQFIYHILTVDIMKSLVMIITEGVVVLVIAAETSSMLQ